MAASIAFWTWFVSAYPPVPRTINVHIEFTPSPAPPSR
jgi:hypothetical protein